MLINDQKSKYQRKKGTREGLALKGRLGGDGVVSRRQNWLEGRRHELKRGSVSCRSHGISLGFSFLPYKRAHSRILKNWALFRTVDFLTLGSEDNEKEKAKKEKKQNKTRSSSFSVIDFTKERMCCYPKCKDSMSHWSNELSVKRLTICPRLSLPPRASADAVRDHIWAPQQ